MLNTKGIPTIDAEFGGMGPTPPAAAAPVEPDKKSDPAAAGAAAPRFRQEIDIGDGSGVQVFEADTADELIAKLAEAQRNATAKIRDLNLEVKRSRLTRETAAEDEQTVPVREVRQMSAEEKFLLAQSLQSDPDAALSRWFEAKFGMAPEDFSRSYEDMISYQEAQAQAQREAAEAVSFVNTHPEYLVNAQNAETMMNFLASERLPVTADNLDYAYSQLVGIGKLQLKPRPETQPRIEPSASERQPVITGLSDRQTATASENRSDLPDDAEFRNLPAAERRARIAQLAWQMRH